MKYTLTKFDHVFDKSTAKAMSFESWSHFETLLSKLYEEKGLKPDAKKFEKGGSPLISPARFKTTVGRKNDNVIDWGGWACLDIDEYEGSFEELLKRFEEKGHYFLYYNTASSTKEKPKFRLVVPLTENVPADKIKHFWFALNKEFDCVGDAQTKDFVRIYYVPAQYPNAYSFFGKCEGTFIDPVELMKKHEYHTFERPSFSSKLPDAVQQKLLEYRVNQLKPISTWSSYHDCPFVYKELISEYKAISNTGWYAKMYQIMVSIANRATKQGYQITAAQIATLVRQIDADNGGWYKNRPVKLEAQRALDYVLSQLL